MSLAAAYRINGQSVPAERFYAAACDPSRSIAVEACAGAGKTWMLVARIIRALLDGVPAQDILAITFTRKAAGEMRGRLNKELQRCARLDEAGLVATLQSWGCGPEEAHRRAPALRDLHELVLRQGRQVQLRTFHSWFSALLRGAPLSVLQELGLPLSFELLEDDKKALPLLWPRFYAALADSEDDKQAFFDSVARHGRHQTLKALEKALEKRVEFVLADTAGIAGSSVRRFEELMPSLAAFERPEMALAGDAVKERWLTRARQLGAEKNKTPQKAASALVDAFATSDGPELLEGRLTALRKAFFVANEDRLNNNLTKFPAALEAEAELQGLIRASRQHEAWLHQQRMVRLSRLLMENYTSLKRERGWVDMNDLELTARRLLGDAELSGWMQQRLDARVRHLLIDEFQDTNPLQWQALYGWLSAYAGAGAGESPVVFLVGDPKQSIYRFRRAEPEVFRAAQAFLVEGLGGALLTCDHTRRCAPAVVQALNSVMLEASGAGEYEGFRSHTTQSEEIGAVVALPAIERPVKEVRSRSEVKEELSWRDSLSQPRVLPEDEGSPGREAIQVADWLAAEIAGGASPEKFMVLARKRSRLRLVHDALRERGISSESPGETQLDDLPAVLDVVALLDALVSTRHQLSLARALKSPLFGWSDADLVALATAVREASAQASGQEDRTMLAAGWWDTLHRLAEAGPAGGLVPDFYRRLQDTSMRLSRYREWVLRLPPHDALSAIYEQADVLARFAASVPPSERGATLGGLRDLLAQSLLQEGGRFLSPYRFVRALKAGGVAASDVHQTGAVRLLTIHGAKGLEADTVLLLDTDSPPQPTESMGVLVDWPARQPTPGRFVFLASEKNPPLCAVDLLEAERLARSTEELNALYVALTRAERRLVLSSFVPHRASERTWWQRLQGQSEALAPPVEAARAGDIAPSFEVAALPALLGVRPPVPVGTALTSPPDVRTRMGRAMHRLLQWQAVGTDTQSWGREHAAVLAREFELSPVATEEVLGMARRVLGGEAAWAWDAAVLSSWENEVEIWHQGELLRMDRLVRRRDSGDWWVLDHKSADRPELQAELQAQLRRYREALQSTGVEGRVRTAFINSAGRLIELDAP